MTKDSQSVLADLKAYGDANTIKLVSSLLAYAVDDLRIMNDTDDEKGVLRNQGAIQELQRINRTITGKE